MVIYRILRILLRMLPYIIIYRYVLEEDITPVIFNGKYMFTQNKINIILKWFLEL